MQCLTAGQYAVSSIHRRQKRVFGGVNSVNRSPEQVWSILITYFCEYWYVFCEHFVCRNSRHNNNLIRMQSYVYLSWSEDAPWCSKSHRYLESAHYFVPDTQVSMFILWGGKWLLYSTSSQHTRNTCPYFSKGWPKAKRHFQTYIFSALLFNITCEVTTSGMPSIDPAICIQVRYLVHKRADAHMGDSSAGANKCILRFLE